MKILFTGMAAMALFVLAANATAEPPGGGPKKGGGGRSNPPSNPAPREQPAARAPKVHVPDAHVPDAPAPTARVPNPRDPGPRVPDARVPGVRVPGVSGGAKVNGRVPMTNGDTRARADSNAALHAAGVNRASKQGIYGNNINIGQRSINIAPSTYRPSYQSHSWHRGYWNNSYGWNPQIGYGQGFGGYGNYGGYGIRLGGIGIGSGGYGGSGGFGGYGYGRYPMSWGYGGWGLGNVLYRSGYSPYFNPYWGGGIGGANYSYNYAQPIYVTSTSPAPSDVANRDFDAAREAFLSGDYESALALVNRAIKDNPSDEVLHEFRALTQFAQQDYRGAAATIHSVLAVGPGWDWATMSSLYSSVDDYTGQLRALETFSKSKPDDAAASFLLGYHYMTTGHPEYAAQEFGSVVKLQPKDQVARELLALVDKPKEGDVAIAPAPGDALPAKGGATVVAKPAVNGPPIDAGAMAGQWQSSREDGSRFGLDLKKDKSFTWKFDQGTRHEDFSGTYTTEGSLLLLQKEDGGAMVGHVAQDGDAKFNFRLLGASADDLGLTFSR